jgi:hypothetical protein
VIPSLLGLASVAQGVKFHGTGMKVNAPPGVVYDIFLAFAVA